MSKPIQTILAITGIGVVLWIISRQRVTETVVVAQPTRTTGTMGFLDQFYGAFNRIPTQSIGGNGATAAAWKAAPAIIRELPGIFSGIGSLFKTTPKTATETASDASFDSSYEDYYATNGYR